MEVRQIKNREDWNDFMAKKPYSLFVQSWSYGEFYKATGEDFWLFGIYDDKKIVGGFLVVSVHAKRGDFLFLPYGPVIDFKNKESFKTLTVFLKKFAKENNYTFVRINPFVNETDDIRKLLKKLNYRNAPMHILAENTWLLDLQEKNEEEMMMGMNKNHRNLIRRCIKEGVKVERRTDLNALKEFNDLHDETARRHDFHRFSREYIENEFKVFVKKDEATIYNAYLPDGRLDSSAIILNYGNMAAYRHGASLMQDKKIPTSYLIQWEVIKDMKEKGLKWYNFWGIAPDDAPKDHPFKGITHFKKGFGGFQKDLIHCQDLVVSYKYWFNWLVETIRREKRGF